MGTGRADGNELEIRTLRTQERGLLSGPAESEGASARPGLTGTTFQCEKRRGSHPAAPGSRPGNFIWTYAAGPRH